MGNNFDLAITLLRDLDDVAEVAGAALNLDAVVKELLESLDVKDLVVDGLRAVEDELLGDLLALDGFLLHVQKVLSLLFYAWRERSAQPSGQQSSVRTVVLGAIFVGI